MGRWHWRSSALTLTCLLAACGGSSGGRLGCGIGQAAGNQLRVAASVVPITNIVSNIAAGSGTALTGLVPEGVNSHTYEPAPSVAAALEDADIVFLNGLGLEEPIKRLALAHLGRGGEVCELGTTTLDPDDYIFDASFPREAGKPNPHLWTDPPLVDRYASLIRDVLSARDPANAALYASNYQAFSTRVAALDEAIRTATATIPVSDRLLLTYHDAFAYFAAEYGWTVLGAVQPSSFDEPTPSDVADLIDQVRATGVPVIFGSEVFASPVLEQIASETGARYVDDLRDDDLPGVPGDADHTWLALIRFNVVTIVEALGGDASGLLALDVSNAAPDTAEYMP